MYLDQITQTNIEAEGDLMISNISTARENPLSQMKQRRLGDRACMAHSIALLAVVAGGLVGFGSSPWRALASPAVPWSVARTSSADAGTVGADLVLDQWDDTRHHPRHGHTPKRVKLAATTITAGPTTPSSTSSPSLGQQTAAVMSQLTTAQSKLTAQLNTLMAGNLITPDRASVAQKLFNEYKNIVLRRLAVFQQQERISGSMATFTYTFQP